MKKSSAIAVTQAGKHIMTVVGGYWNSHSVCPVGDHCRKSSNAAFTLLSLNLDIVCSVSAIRLPCPAEGTFVFSSQHFTYEGFHLTPTTTMFSVTYVWSH